MSFSFRPAKRENVGLLIGLAGGTGSGKTLSALKLATGLANGQPFALIDTEARRALHYADDYSFEHAALEPPFRPERYAEAIKAADAAGYPVIVVDSASHEHAGEGGLLDWHEEELTRMAGDDWKRRDAMTFSAWIKPKAAHKRFVAQLLQLRAHVILCMRAEEKIEIGKDANGKTVVRPKRSLTGLDGWIPVCEKNLPYELTISCLLTADAPGIPKPIKLQEQHRAFLPLDQPVSEQAGVLLGEWARGGKANGNGARRPQPAPEDEPSEEFPPRGVIPVEPRGNLEPHAELARAAGMAVVPSGRFKGKTLAEVKDAGEEGLEYFRWALDSTRAMRKESHRDHVHFLAVEAFARVALPELSAVQAVEVPV